MELLRQHEKVQTSLQEILAEERLAHEQEILLRTQTFDVERAHFEERGRMDQENLASLQRALDLERQASKEAQSAIQKDLDSSIQ